MFNTSVNKIQKLQQQSASALGVFRKTVSDLSLINTSIIEEQNVRKQQIEKLQEEQSVLEAQLVENAHFIDKINDFLGVTK